MTLSRAIIIESFLPFTKRHEDLIKFAHEHHTTEKQFEFTNSIQIIMPFKSNEPFIKERTVALRNWCANPYKSAEVYYRIHNSNNEPDVINDYENYCKYWADTIDQILKITDDDVIYSSDLNFINVSKKLKCQFVPFIRFDEKIDTPTSTIRKNPQKYFNLLAGEFQNIIRPTITFIGSESSGKTTLSRRLSQKMNATYIPDFSKSISGLNFGKITEVNISKCFNGQLALKSAMSKSIETPFIFQDTDLLQILGYWEKLMPTWLIPTVILTNKVKMYKANLYILMNDDVKFTSENNQFGKNERITTVDFWKQKLTEYDFVFHTMKSTSMKEQFFEAQDVINAFFLDRVKEMIDFNPGDHND